MRIKKTKQKIFKMKTYKWSEKKGKSNEHTHTQTQTHRRQNGAQPVQNKTKNTGHILTHTLCVCRNVGFFEWRILWFFFYSFHWNGPKTKNKTKIRNQLADIMMMIINNNDINQIEIHSWSSFICFFSAIWWLWCEYDRHLNVEIFGLNLVVVVLRLCLFVYLSMCFAVCVSWWWWFWSRICSVKKSACALISNDDDGYEETNIEFECE